MSEQLKTNASIIQSRYLLGQLLGITHAGARDIYTACGWKKDLNFSDYYNHYRRSNIAGTIVDIMPKECFSTFPKIKEKDVKDKSEFEIRFKQVDEQTKLFHNLVQVDKFSGIHRYAILLLGFNDSNPLDTPVEKASELLYVKPYLECNASVLSYESDVNNPRYGLPKTYELTANNLLGTKNLDLIVHYSRIIHVAENPIESSFLGTPRLERVYNNIENIVKISASGAEGYWKGVFSGLGLSMDKDATLTTAQAEAMKQEIQDYENNLSRVLKLKGIEPKILTQQPISSEKQIDVELKLISFTIGIPKRILEGSERGELSSGQDKDAFDRKIITRQIQYLEPIILRPTIDKLIKVGVLPQVEYEIDWADTDVISTEKEVDINKKKTEMLTTYAKVVEARDIIPPLDFLIEFLKFDEIKAQQFLDSVNSDLLAETNQIIADQKTIEKNQNV